MLCFPAFFPANVMMLCFMLLFQQWIVKRAFFFLQQSGAGDHAEKKGHFQHPIQSYIGVRAFSL